MIRLAVFASGTGSNLENLIRYFQGSKSIVVALVVSNHQESGAIEIALRQKIKTLILSADQVKDGNFIAAKLQEEKIDNIILAGYLKMIPVELIRHYPEKIINIHPSLLPKFGGKGMYGRHVHEAVALAGESETGITVHFVNEEYDKGRIIEQKKVNLPKGANADLIEKEVKLLEQRWFPDIIANNLKE